MKHTSILLVVFSIVVASWHVVHGTLDFHTDIARDFLLFEDIYFGHHITLLGPRSGGISGVFHGPLWLYLSIPAYAIGNGNPVVVAWFWVLLYIFSIGLVYYVVQKLSEESTAYIASAIYAVSTANAVHSMFNPFGAVILAPVFFLLLYRYLTNGGFQTLSLLIFTLGIMIQFQMAFAGPMLVLSAPLIFYAIYKRRSYKDIVAYGFLVIPLSTFIVFDLRHDFLQTRAVISYLSGGENAVRIKESYSQFVATRLTTGMLYESIAQVVGYVGITVLATWAIIVLGYIKASGKQRDVYHLFLYLFIGFWIITLPYKGTMWGYYTWPFVGLTAGMIALALQSTPRYLQILFFALFLTTQAHERIIPIMEKSFADGDTSGWKFYEKAAEHVYKDATSPFGYYIYTTDQYGYTTRYAMNYLARKYPEKNAYAFAKREETYLMIDDPGDHKYTNHKGWREYDVKIIDKPVSKTQLSKTYWIEKYSLTKEDQAIESNPNLIQNLIFR